MIRSFFSTLDHGDANSTVESLNYIPNEANIKLHKKRDAQNASLLL